MVIVVYFLSNVNQSLTPKFGKLLLYLLFLSFHPLYLYCILAAFDLLEHLRKLNVRPKYVHMATMF